MIIIRPDTAAPAEATALGRQLVALADGDQTRVTTGHGGFVVDNDLAAAYLNVPVGPSLALPAGTPAPPGVAGVVADAEARIGVRRPTRKAMPPSQGEDRR